MLRKLSAACTLALLVSTHPAQGAGIDANAKVLAQLDDEFSKAAGTRDAERVASFYAEDAITYPPGMPMAMGRAASQRVWATFFANATFKISWKADHASVDGGLGFTAGTYEDSYKGPDGKVVKETGKYVCTWAKQKDGSWKAAHDIWNADK
jgi:ketosteroid isomerase-like protein